MNEPTFPGCVIEARPVGMLKMIDKGEMDYKVLAVPATDPNFDEYHDLENLPKHFLKEVQHFFMVYKELQGTQSTNDGWVSAEPTKQAIEESIVNYRKNFPQGQGV
jgi:inorganic pyrophosphatase